MRTSKETFLFVYDARKFISIHFPPSCLYVEGKWRRDFIYAVSYAPKIAQKRDRVAACPKTRTNLRSFLLHVNAKDTRTLRAKR